MENLLFIILGEVLGVIVGVLPGIGTVMTVATLLPLTFGMAPVPALSLLAGIYMGSQFGGSITAILLNVPGSATAAVATLDGYEMTRQGKAGVALGITAFSSWIAGTLAVLLLMTVGTALAQVALAFSPAEYFALMFLGLTLITSLASKSMIKGVLAGVFGLVLGTVGIDPISGVARFNFGSLGFLDGIDVIAVMIGLFAVSEVFMQLEGSIKQNVFNKRVTALLPNGEDLRRSAVPIARGSIVGSVVGFLPGAGATIASFLSYTIEKRFSKHPERFGRGAIEGVAAPGGADNAAAGTALIPLLTLGIPGSETTAVLMGALMLLGLQPGPLFFTQQSEIVWGLIAALWIGNLIGLLLATVGVPYLTKILRTPTSIMNAFILGISFVGAYAANNSMVGVWVMFIFGVIGYAMKKTEIPVAPVVLALVLGPMTEEALRQALLMGEGSFLIFLRRPISATLLGIAMISLFFPLISSRGWRRTQSRRNVAT